MVISTAIHQIFSRSIWDMKFHLHTIKSLFCDNKVIYAEIFFNYGPL